jgi:hypothetical protein
MDPCVPGTKNSNARVAARIKLGVPDKYAKGMTAESVCRAINICKHTKIVPPMEYSVYKGKMYFIDPKSPLSVRDFVEMFSKGGDIKSAARKLKLVTENITDRELRSNIIDVLKNLNISEPIEMPMRAKKNATTPNNGNARIPNNGNGNGNARTPGNGNARTPNNGNGNARAPNNGNGNARTPNNGNGSEEKPAFNLSARPQGKINLKNGNTEKVTPSRVPTGSISIRNNSSNSREGFQLPSSPLRSKINLSNSRSYNNNNNRSLRNNLERQAEAVKEEVEGVKEKVVGNGNNSAVNDVIKNELLEKNKGF